MAVQSDTTLADPSSPRGGSGDAGATRDALLAAAHERFARQGYDGTTLRQVAGDVGVDAALVIRYFGSKEHLFLEVTRPEPVLHPIVVGTPLPELGEALVRAVLTCGGDLEPPLLALLRSSGYERFAAALRSRMDSDLLEILVERLPGADTRLRSELLCAQVLGLIIMRTVLLGGAAAAGDPETLVREYAPALQELITPRGTG